MLASHPSRRPDHLAIRDDPEQFGLTIVDGVAHVEEADLRRVADEVGTPTYVYGARHIEERYRELESSLASGPTLICYAVKANSSQAILRLLARCGAGADIVSSGELERVLAAGIEPAKVIFSGVGKRDDEIDAALAAGIRSINVESEQELEQVAARALARGQIAPVSLRLNPDVDPHTHPYLATGLREAKFGIPMGRGRELALSMLGRKGLELVGLACHVGSQIVTAAPFLDSFERLKSLVIELRNRKARLQFVDLGGGMGVPYAPDEPVLDVPAWGKAVGSAVHGLGVELVVEPGRYIVGNAGVLLSRVVTRKRGEDKTFVVLDAAMNDLLRPALYESYHAVVPVEVPGNEHPIEQVDVVGPVCECGDFIARARMMPRLEVGDLVVILTAGAYGMTMASNYNTRPRAPEVMVRGGSFSVTRPRRTVADLIDEELYPDWLT
jgi:diaminopimelate decarboxylase